MGHKLSAIPLMIFGTLWCGFIGFFIWMAGPNMYWQVMAEGFPTTPGIVTSSNIDVDSDSYRAKIVFEYEVNGKAYESDTYRFGTIGTSNSGTSKAVKKRFPAGQEVTVYYDANDPERAVLVTGLQKVDYVLCIFLMPFVCVGIGIWLGVSKILFGKSYNSSGGVKVKENGDEVVAEFERTPGVAVALIIMGASGFVGAFLFGFAGDALPLIAAQGYFALLVGGGLYAGVSKTIKNRMTPRQLVFDVYRDKFRFTYGEHTEWMDFDQIRSIHYQRDKKRKSSRDFSVDLTLKYVANDGEEVERKLTSAKNTDTAMRWIEYVCKLTGFDPIRERVVKTKPMKEA
ncbi:hypothetical protein KS4_06580 [Poriferisphaera corsica]|uniref:DUF3592 domain-containing protein n=1 Tax=Poriferisphaera corsica TaxID=2528020 RepID=A0A517YQY4_9BACT|nr:DUF3592 domain-containing protein [Poriferisphaera corsica]QDU32624.1 hypothetical protein KS4_06580 [Poriferisphaera corsica]